MARKSGAPSAFLKILLKTVGSPLLIVSNINSAKTRPTKNLRRDNYQWGNLVKIPLQNRLIPDMCQSLHIATNNTISLSKDNEAARRRCRKRIVHTLRKPTTLPTKLAKESETV